MTTASKITIVRILMIPLFMWAALSDRALLALALFVLASATDWLDGYVARKYNQISDFGKFLDPLADKLLVFSALLIFIEWGRVDAWVVMVLLTREFFISGLRMVAAAKGSVIAAGFSGKIKTVCTILGITLMLTSFHDRVLFAAVTIDQLAIAVMVFTTVYSGVEYMMKNWNVLKDA